MIGEQALKDNNVKTTRKGQKEARKVHAVEGAKVLGTAWSPEAVYELRRRFPDHELVTEKPIVVSVR